MQGIVVYPDIFLVLVTLFWLLFFDFFSLETSLKRISFGNWYESIFGIIKLFFFINVIPT